LRVHVTAVRNMLTGGEPPIAVAPDEYEQSEFVE
jgi:hypothetical protein